AAVLRAERVGFEPVEYLFQHLGRNARAAVGYREDHRVGAPLRPQRYRCAARREAHGIGQEVEEDLPQAAFVGGERADVLWRADVQREARAGEAILHAFGGGRHGGADIDGAEIELHAAGIDGGEVEDVVDQGQRG